MAEEVQKKLIIKKKIYNRLKNESIFYENEIEQLYEIGTDVFQNNRRLPVFRYLSLGIPVPNANFQ